MTHDNGLGLLSLFLTQWNNPHWNIFVWIYLICSLNGADRKPPILRNFISQEEIKELAVAQTAKGAIEVARPT